MILAPTVTDLWLSLVRAGSYSTDLKPLMERENDDAPWFFYYTDGYDGDRIGRVERPFGNSYEVGAQCRALNAFREQCDSMGIDSLTVDRAVFEADNSGTDDYVARPYRGQFDE